MLLTNGLVRFDFDDATGSLRQITNVKNGQRWLQDPRGSRLAKLIAPTPGHVSRPLFSHEAGRPEISRAGDTLQIQFPELRDGGGRAGIFMTARVRLPAGSQEAFFSLTIHNASSYRVNEMWFPWIGGRAGVPGKTKDRVTTSKRMDYDVFARFARGREETHTFGHHLQRWGDDGISQLPMMDLSNPAGGLSYIKYEQRPSPHNLVFENMLQPVDGYCLTWAWATGCFVEPGQTWTSAEVGVGVHDGDWHATADRLRQWAMTWWKPCDTPRAVREKIGLLHIHTEGFSGKHDHALSELPAVARDAQRFGVHDLMFWDYAASVYYRPDRGDFWEMPPARLREMKRALRDTRGLGTSVSAFVNWRLACRRNRSWRAMKPMLQESLFGQGMYGFPPGSMDGGVYVDAAYEMGSYSVCCGSDQFQPFARKLLKQTLDLGFDVIAVDQAAEWNYCLSRKHGHASPWDAWERTYAWFRDATRATRTRNPAAYTVAELPDLYNTQHIDLWWNWGWRQNQWVSAPVFRYVLPPMIPCWCIDENQRDVIAEAFAIGSFMAIATRDMTGLLSEAPALAEQVARLAKLRKATAAYVNHGIFRDTIGLDVKGGKGFVYTSKRGLAVTLANSSPRAARLKVQLAPDTHGFQTRSPGVLHVEGAAPMPAKTTRRNGRLIVDVQIPPYAAGVLTWDTGK